MSYKKKFEQSDKKALNSLIAQKILDLMDKLRLDANSNAQRRWVWELLQNAKDVAFDDQQVATEINIQNLNDIKSVSFSHNGKPFTVDNITFLIKQVSTKERNTTENNEKPKTTGKFGTGFLTTHLLSEKVEVSGVVKEPDLDYRNFVLPLDRSGRSTDQIIESVNKSISVRDTLDSQPTLAKYNSNNFNTTFHYNLDEKGYNVAKVGVEDLHLSLPYTLAFLPSIKSVSIKHENVIYELSKIESLTELIKVSTIHKKIFNETTVIKIITLEKNNTTIAVEIEQRDDKIYLKSLSNELPKIFCDFPLIGTNDFTLPFAINNPNFNPTEPRDGVWLTDHNTEPKILENKEIFQNSLELYFELLDYAINNNWENLFLLANTETPTEKKWLSKSWFETKIQIPIRTKLLKLPIVNLENGEKTSILDEQDSANVYFPYHPKKEVRERIWELEYKLFPDKIPAKVDIHNWYDVVWNDRFKHNLEEITEFIVNKKNLDDLSKRLKNNLEKSIEWLNEYFDLINFEEKFIENIIADKFSVIPNQKGVFKKKSELKIDQNIEEELKNVLEILSVDIRESLRHKDIRTASKYKDTTEGQITYHKRTQEDIVDEINKVLEGTGTNKNPNSGIAISYLISLFSEDNSFPKHREILYQFCTDLIPSEIAEKKIIGQWSETIWKNCDKQIIGRFISIVSKSKNINTLQDILRKKSLQETFDWVNSFIDFLNQQGLSEKMNLKTLPILPNQKGDFCIKDDLFLDNGQIDESLKDILEALGYSIKAELLEKNIFLELPKNRERNAKFVADEITRLITPRFSEFPRSEKTKEVFKSLFLWFNQNKKAANELFESLYNNKHKLYDDDEIAANLEKAEILDEIIGETGLSPKEIKDKLKALLTNPNIADILKIPTEQQLAVSSGLYHAGSEEDIAISLTLIDNLSDNSRISIGKDAKDIILQELKDKNFKVSENLQINYTIVDGVINPDGNPVKLVVKSAKAGKIYFNPNEWLALAEDDSQLFVLTAGNKVRNVTLTDLQKVNDEFHMRFNTEQFVISNLQILANFFKGLPYTHFIFTTPESTTDYLQQFGLSDRNPSSKVLTADDKNLLL
ncbi:MAG: hypothetical protein ORN85_00015 [Sediminibacterium sp.]|nr:hypothetical protein [Sediminibacterium sp.]